MCGYKKLKLAFIFFALLSCQQSLPTLTNFDKEKWVNDKNGCEGDRDAMIINLLDQKENILSLNESQIIRLLGRPDKIQLYQRNQKFFLYIIQPDSNCVQSALDQKAMRIRFSAVGRSQEITYE